jgi:hypothetical protein
MHCNSFSEMTKINPKMTVNIISQVHVFNLEINYNIKRHPLMKSINFTRLIIMTVFGVYPKKLTNFPICASTMKNLKLAKFLVIVALVFIKFFGIFPIKFDCRSKKYVISKFELLYAVSHTIFFVYGYSFITDVYLDNLKDEFKQNMVFLFLTTFCRLLGTSVVIFHASQIYNCQHIVRFINETYRHMTKVIEKIPLEVNYGVVVKTLFGRMVFLLFNFTLTVVQPMSYMKSADLYNVGFAVLAFTPYFIGTLLVSTYLAAALFLEHGYVRIAVRLQSIRRAIDRTKIDYNSTRFQFLTVYCLLSDEIAELLYFYGKLNDLLKQLVRIASQCLFFTTTLYFLSPIIVVRIV